MAIHKEELIEFLAQRPMFAGIEEHHLARIADRMQEFQLEAGKPVFSHGDRGSVFYILYSGRARMWRTEQKQAVELGELEPGDKFGEEALLFSRPRPYSITTLEDCQFLTMHKPDFNWLLNRYPETRAYLETTAHTRQQARSLRFDWLQRGEVVRLMTRRHPAELILDLFKPALALLVAGVILSFTSLMGTLDSLKYVAYGIGYPLIGIAILWAIWEVLDWRNDFFFITNQRVVWLEQVILQSASRQEAPLAAIQSVDVSTSQIGRIFGFGDVFVRTFTGTGSLTLTSIDNPRRFKKEIEELLIRVRDKQEETADAYVRQSVRQSLGLESAPVEDNVLRVVEPEELPKKGIFKTREVVGDTITYHKHWWVILSKAWLWLLALLGTIAGVITLAVNNFVLNGFTFPVTSTLFFAVLVFFTILGVLTYQYLDWKNDIYQLTSDMVIDSEKKPLGREISKSAPIRNIISLEHQRKGILPLILNFGVVRIVVADETLTFYDVGNPALIQQDIYYRQEQLKLKEEEQAQEKDRAHLSKWLQTYHDVLQTELEPPTDDSGNIG
jgi:CRP-like cAMP-binding protein